MTQELWPTEVCLQVEIEGESKAGHTGIGIRIAVLRQQVNLNDVRQTRLRRRTSGGADYPINSESVHTSKYQGCPWNELAPACRKR